VFLKNGEGEGLSLIPGPRAGLIIRGLVGVCDMASGTVVVEEVRAGFPTYQTDGMALEGLEGVENRRTVGEGMSGTQLLGVMVRGKAALRMVHVQ
jgi:hypothetical protein